MLWRDIAGTNPNIERGEIGKKADDVNEHVCIYCPRLDREFFDP